MTPKNIPSEIINLKVQRFDNLKERPRFYQYLAIGLNGNILKVKILLLVNILINSGTQN